MTHSRWVPRRRPVFLILVAFLAGCVAWLPTARAATGEPVEDAAAELFWWGEFDKLEALYAQVKATHLRDAQGRRDLDYFRAGLGRIFFGSRADSIAYYSQLVQATRSYADGHPQSSLGHAMAARALHARAWAIRGGSVASEVPPQAMAAFRKDIAAAEQYVADHSPVLARDSTTHLYLLMIGRAAGWAPNKHWAVLQDALTRDPDDLDVYPEMMTTMAPKWGGDAHQLEAVVQDAVRRTRQDWGLAMYAHVYMTTVYDQEGGFFRNTLALWDTMKQGFDDLLARYPDPVNLNRYAMVACLAEDKPTTVALLGRLGAAVNVRHWGSGQSGQRRFDACSRWASEK